MDVFILDACALIATLNDENGSDRVEYILLNAENKKIYEVSCSYYPEGINYLPILDFLNDPLKPLSLKATKGFLKRVKESTLIKYPPEFILSLEKYLKNTYND